MKWLPGRPDPTRDYSDLPLQEIRHIDRLLRRIPLPRWLPRPRALTSPIRAMRPSLWLRPDCTTRWRRRWLRPWARPRLLLGFGNGRLVARLGLRGQAPRRGLQAQLHLRLLL